MLPNEEPSVTEIDDDDDEYVPANVTREEMGTTEDVKSSDSIKEKDLNDTTESDVEIQEPNIPFTDLDTYEEKLLPEVDETSQLSLVNVKIKEEPKDDDDEDDGFEDVGTVVIRADDEISIQSSGKFFVLLMLIKKLKKYNKIFILQKERKHIRLFRQHQQCHHVKASGHLQ